MKEQFREQADRLKALAAASHAFAESAQDYQATLDMIVRQVAEALGDFCAIRLLSDDGRRLEMASIHDIDPQTREATRLLLTSTPLRADDPNLSQPFLESTQAILLPDHSQNQLLASVRPEHQLKLKHLEAHSQLIVPIHSRRQAIGFLIIARKPGSPVFQEQDLDLAKDMAGWTSLALNNARLFKQVQNELTERERAEEQFRLVVEAAPSAMIVVNRQGNIILVNSRTQELFGYQREELLGSPIEMLVPERFHSQHPEYQASFFENPQARPMGAGRDLFGLRKDGMEVPVEIGLTPLKTLEGVVVLASIIDITERKRAEDEIKRTLIELTRSNQELEQFAYVASHDLQEPLRMVSSYLQLLSRRYQGQLDSDADEFIAFAVEGANRMKVLINDLLAFSRVGTRGKEFAPVALEHVLELVEKNLQVTIEETRALITHDPLPQIMADNSQMVQLFQNLIENAIKFRGQTSPKVHIGAKRQADSWLLSVRDNGIGFEAQFAERIFIIFQRLHTRNEYSGTGIGLAICRKIVERHGGRIWVESHPDEGATFYFTMPKLDAAEAAKKKTPAARI
jgi:PAS domain S-box-containing protein